MLKVNVQVLVMVQRCFPIPPALLPHPQLLPPGPHLLLLLQSLSPATLASCCFSSPGISWLWLFAWLSPLHLFTPKVNAGTNLSSSLCLLRHHFLNKADLDHSIECCKLPLYPTCNLPYLLLFFL